jgi:hypothetical protein
MRMNVTVMTVATCQRLAFEVARSQWYVGTHHPSAPFWALVLGQPDAQLRVRVVASECLLVRKTRGHLVRESGTLARSTHGGRVVRAACGRH